jgi:hypothetical protein
LTFDPLAHRDDDTTADGAGQDEGADRTSFEPQDEQEASSPPSAQIKRLSLSEIKDRDELLTGCVKQLKMTAPQIAEFSRMWQHPFYDERDVWRRVKALKLDKKLKHVARQSLHDEHTLRTFLKIARDATRNGYPLSEISKEHRIGDGSSIRADMKFRIGNRLFYLETQRSSLLYQSWSRKLGKYVAYRRRKPPFRVLIVFEDERDLNVVHRYAREIMKPYPGLNLFLFAWLPDLLSHYDIVTEDVWTTPQAQPVALV